MAGYGLKDASKSVSKALPSGASAITTDSIDLEKGSAGDFVAPCELLIEAPAVTTAMLGDAATIKYDVIHSDNADLSSPVTLAATVLTQTGAGGAGAAAASCRFRPPTNVKRYVGAKATKSAAGDASTKSVVVSLVF
jgi:hypothetical protein